MELAFRSLFFGLSALGAIFTVVSNLVDMVSLSVLQKILIVIASIAFVIIACLWPNSIEKFAGISKQRRFTIFLLISIGGISIIVTILVSLFGSQAVHKPDPNNSPTPTTSSTPSTIPTIESSATPTISPTIEITPTKTIPLPTATAVLTFSAETMAAYQSGKDYYDDGDYKAAYPLLLKAALAGHSNAQLYTGICLQQKEVNGGDGAASAAEWFLLASNQGNDQAQYELGKCYLAGDGVVKDYETAFYWFMESSSKENKNGLLWAGFCYHYGLGVAQDYNKAMEYYVAAQEQGHSYAKVRIQKLLVDMQNAE